MNDIDRLNSLDPLNLSRQDIDDIIAYHRSQRARRAAGEKPTKTSSGVDISEVVKNITKSAPAVKIDRRF